SKKSTAASPQSLNTTKSQNAISVTVCSPTAVVRKTSSSHATGKMASSSTNRSSLTSKTPFTKTQSTSSSSIPMSIAPTFQKMTTTKSPQSSKKSGQKSPNDRIAPSYSNIMCAKELLATMAIQSKMRAAQVP